MNRDNKIEDLKNRINSARSSKISKSTNKNKGRRNKIKRRAIKVAIPRKTKS